MDKLIKQSIDARKNAFSASFNIEDETQKKIDVLFSEINKLGERCKDVGEFETEFQKSSLNQEYLDLFTKITTKGTVKTVAKGTIKGAIESAADQMVNTVLPTRASVHQKASDTLRKIPGVGDLIDVSEKASYAAHLGKIFKKDK